MAHTGATGSPGRPAILMLKRKLVIALAVLAAAAFAGGAYASTRDSPKNARQAFLNDVAKRLHVTPAQLNSALTGALQDQLNAAVKAGKLTRAQANAIQQRVKANGGVPFLGPRFAPGGPPALFGPRGFEVKRGAARGMIAAELKYLGLTPQQLRTQLRAGKSLAQIAQAKGKTAAGLKAAMTAAIKARLDKAVAAKQMTPAKEKKLLSRLSWHLDRLINEKPGTERTLRGPGAPGPGAPGPGAPGKPGAGGGPGWGPPPGGPWGSPGGPPAAAPGGHPGSYVPTP